MMDECTFVDELDAAIVAENWRSGPDATWFQGDFNGGRWVNDADASIMAANWTGGPAESTSVPEPGTITLIMGGLLGLLACGARRTSRQT